MKKEETLNLLINKAPAEKPIELDLEKMSKFYSPYGFLPISPSSEPVSKEELHKALALTAVTNSPKMAAFGLLGAAAGTLTGNPLVTIAASKLAPLGYAAYKYMEIKGLDPVEFRRRFDASKAALMSGDSDFTRAFGQEFLMNIPERYVPAGSSGSVTEAFGSMAGMISRDVILSAGFGGAALRMLRPEILTAAKAGDAGAKALVRLAEGTAFSTSMGIGGGTSRYNLEIANGTDDETARNIAFSSGIASGVSGLLFMAAMPAVATKYGVRVFDKWYQQPFKGSATWAGWAGVQNSVNNIVREDVYGMAPDPQTQHSFTDYAHIAALGAMFSVAGLGMAYTGRKLTKQVAGVVQQKRAAKEVAQEMEKVLSGVDETAETAAEAQMKGMVKPVSISTEEIISSTQPEVKPINNTEARKIQKVLQRRNIRMTKAQTKFFANLVREKMSEGKTREQAIAETWESTGSKEWITEENIATINDLLADL